MNIPAQLVGFFAPPFDSSYDTLARIERDGLPWAVATDGRMCLAIQTESDLPPAGKEWPKRLQGLFEAVLVDGSPTLGPLPVARLREWAGEIPPPTEGECEQCDGEGNRWCSHCGTEHECQCCDGTGKAEIDPDWRPGDILGLIVDMHRVARLTAHLDGDCTLDVRTVSTAKGSAKMLTITGPGWQAWLAPAVSPDYPCSPCAERPTFTGV